MPGHLSAEQIARYRERRIPPEELLQVDDHIFQCAECRERLASANELRAALQSAATFPLPGQPRRLSSVPVEPHLAYEQLEAYVDGKMPRTDRAAAEAHLELCRACHDDVRDLNSFKAEWARASRGEKEGWWASFVALWLTPRRVTVALAGAVVIVMAVAVERWKSPSPHGVSPVGTANSNPTGEENLSAIKALPPDEQSAVLEAISQQKIKSPDALGSLHGQQETLLGESSKSSGFEVLEPAGEVVAEVRPVFRWQPLAGAINYSVAIFDPKLNLVQSSPAVTATQWTADRPLKRGQTYLWQVTAKLSNGQSVSSPRPPSPQARFLVLDQRKADELSQFQAAHPEAHLALGILYAEAGLLKQGEHELEQLPKSDPNYDLAQKLSKSIQEIRNPPR
jgi:putative zinc finger protein